MKHSKTSIALSLALGFLTGCSTSSHVTVGQTRPAVSPQSVKVYLRPPAKFEEIALLDTNSLWSFRFSQQGHMDSAMARIKAEAAKLGANGVLLQGVGTEYVGSVATTSGTAYGTATGAFGTSTTFAGSTPIKAAKGVAIYVTQE